MYPDEVLHEARARLAEAGLLVDRDGDAFTLGWRNSTVRMHAEFFPSLTLSAVESHPGFDPEGTLFVSEYVNAKTADALRRRDLQFVDANGNMNLLNDNWLINIQGRRAGPRTRPERYASENLFSPRRAQVIFVLLTWPQLMDAPLRDVSAAAGVSLGLAQSTVVALKENHRMWPAQSDGRERLIDAWVAAFPAGLAPSLRLRQFRAENFDLFFGDGLELSGEAARSSGLRPNRATVYVEHLDDTLVMANRWRSDGPHNLTVRRKFWRAPWGPDEDGPRDAPPLIVYGDLISSDDPRLQEAAGRLRRQL
jgi:hypothetical protein